TRTRRPRSPRPGRRSARRRPRSRSPRGRPAEPPRARRRSGRRGFGRRRGSRPGSSPLRRRQSRHLRSLPAPAPAKPPPALLGGSVEPTPVVASVEPTAHAGQSSSAPAGAGARVQSQYLVLEPSQERGGVCVSFPYLVRLPLRDEVDLDGPLEGADRLAAAEQLADRLATFLAVVLRQLVHVHGDETVAEGRVEPAAEAKRVAHRLLAVRQPGGDRIR